ncbi:MarR family transcriptional regulator [Sandaracinobacter sp. RS1-74]|uniref:MarR family winged helix-turn-helix transcriptional regulator n=1 Tax=Sandaracinobacteroides sayramensis TaxID=2913411 RepID=UPI001EDA0BD2|nr:MarR family transcriptional regulator [Sandaracinobacteroides sayramensis]MCG2840902.1 MarR family transcriptional regulator [Sandaracinobacteroides sayramensis]
MTDKESTGSFRLGFLIHDVSRLRRTVVDKAMKPMDVTRSQWWVLSNLSRDPNNQMMQTELAHVLDIGKVALGGLLDRLEAVGYVERRADPMDRRAKRVIMTARGAQMMKRIQKQAVSLNTEMLDGIPASELQQMEDILHRMKQRLRAMDSELKVEQMRKNSERKAAV